MALKSLTDLSIIPETMNFSTQSDKRILVADFDDTATYHPALTTKILELEVHERAAHKPVPGACGTKIYDLDQWGCAEADFLCQRIFGLVSQMFDLPQTVVDLSWASVYQRRDYCMPHSHVRSKIAVVYLLDEGDPIDRKKDPFGGRLCFVDPRIPASCPHGEGILTRPLFPTLKAGSMIVFPSDFIHWVPPYMGKKPRITLSWDISDVHLPGSPIKDFSGL